MPSRVANCPNCGGQVEFKAGNSLLSVCSYCASAVARTGDDIGELEILGQVAPLADLGSPLSLGTSGRHGKKSFTIVGQLQLDYGEGPWNEWYASFDDGSWGWIAEAQGRVYLTFGREVPGLPSYEQAGVGTRFSIGDRALIVTERRRARFTAAQGELPFAVSPGTHFQYADVQGPDGLFGTVDYGTGSTPEALFLGQDLAYEALFDKATLREVEPGQAASAEGLNCPNCGSGVPLRAPDEAMRVTCEACGSLLGCSAVSQGQSSNLSLLRAADRPGPDPKIPLGSVGKLQGGKWTVFGHLTRSVSFEGETWSWEEYLLHGGVKNGYRWLTDSDGHWTWIDPVHAGDVTPDGARAVKLGETSYRHYQSSSARIDSIRGEFYWKVAVGERTGTADYIKPPFVLSREKAASEVNWSLGTYLEPKVVQEAFGLEDAPGLRIGVAPHQPNPHGPALKVMLRFGGVFSAALLIVALIMGFTSDNAVVLQQDWPLVTPKLTPEQKAKTRGLIKGDKIQSKTFTLASHSNVAIEVTSDVKDFFLFLDGEFVDLTTNQSRRFGVEVNTRSKHSGASAWGRGGRHRVVFLGDLDAGNYVIRARPQWYGTTRPPTRMQLEVREDVFIGSHAIIIFFLLWVLPLLKAVQYYSFEKRRWADSDHAG